MLQYENQISNIIACKHPLPQHQHVDNEPQEQAILKQEQSKR